ncbi:type IV secretory system conjugative DNA transfer family protein [Fastidiosibacter lacustris]|uniref:type IV secretory system conjugative DNA transfer family protein n=1 Tax=Fastidiosibacter lacustris TaxID=2056695 RepID=UPI000E34E5FD|nr:type IV secretory system conjugative DNA transfer family protein [Fastidiosibacter lacustris]
MIAIELHQLENLNTNAPIVKYDSTHLTLRQKAIKEAALELGIQSGLYVGQNMINKSLDKLAPMLYQTYNFNTLLLSDNILPPIIETGYNQSNVGTDNRKITLNGQSYHITRQAYFVSTVPTWRDYLITHFTQPELPDRSVLPQNEEEQKIWKTVIRYAWESGIEQAVDIFKQQVYKLNRDFRGMVMYYELINRNMIVPPYITKETKAIISDSDNLAIDNKEINLKIEPQFQSNTELWQVMLDPLHDVISNNKK